MDELASAAGKLTEQLRGRTWFRGVELGTDPRDGKPALLLGYGGLLTADDFGDGPIGFVDDFPVFIVAPSSNRMTVENLRRLLATELTG